MSQLLGHTHRLGEVRPAVAHVDPTGPGRRAAGRLDPPDPELRLPVAVPALGRRLPVGGRPAEFELLVGQTQDLTGFRDLGQAVVREEPAARPVADRTDPIEGGVAGGVELGGVVEDEDGGVLSHGPAGLSPVWGLDGGHRRGLVVAEAIEPFELSPVEELGERLLGVGGDGRRGGDQPPGSSDVAEIGVGKRYRCDVGNRQALRAAFYKLGVPEQLLVDNGSVYCPSWRRMGAIPLPPKSTVDEHIRVQAAFLRDERAPELAEAAAGTWSVWFVDAAHFVRGTFLCCVWSAVRMFVRGSSGRRRFNVLGAWDATTGELLTAQNDTRVSSDMTIELLGQLSQMGTVSRTIVLDNARYQTCAAVTAEAARLGTELL